MILERLKKNKIREVAGLYEKEMSRHFRNVGEKPITAKEYENILRKNFKKSKMFFLFDNKIIGFVWYVKEGNEFNLEEIFVIEKGKGYGKRLMNYILKDARKNKIKKINADIHYGNRKAINFMKKFGFSERTIEMSKEIK